MGEVRGRGHGKRGRKRGGRALDATLFMKQLWHNRRNVLLGLAIGVQLVLVTWVAHYGGGSSGSYIHFYYFPIILAAYFLGDLGAAVTAVTAAALAGLLYLHTFEGQRQPPEDIVIRGLLFLFVGVVTSRLFAKLNERRADAASLLKVSRFVNASLRPTEVLRTIAETAVAITHAKACSIRLLNRERTELVLATSYGLSLDYLSKGPHRVSENPLDQEVVAGKTLSVLDVRLDPRFRFHGAAQQENLVSLLSLPLRKGEAVFGTLSVYSESRHEWTYRERRLLQAFAEQAGVAIHNARLHDDLRRNYWETVSALARAIEAKDSHTLGHSERVTDYALQLGTAAELGPEQMETLRFAASLHDIGKLGVGEEHGRGDLSDEIVMRMHPLIGISILQPIEFLGPALAAVRSHHERWDGNGYPEGLAGEEIPFLARLLAVADLFDRLQLDVPGRAGLTRGEASQELRRLGGTALDPKLAELFVRTLERQSVEG